LLASGRYLAILPQAASLLVRHLPIRTFAVDFQGIVRSVGIMTLKGRALSPLARSFIEGARLTAEAISRRRHSVAR